MMKRILSSIFILLLSLSLFSAPIGKSSFMPSLARSNALGGTGIGSASEDESIYLNPALLSFNEDYVKIPSLTLGVYNVKNMVAPGGAFDIFASTARGNDRFSEALKQAINSIGFGDGEISETDISFGFQSGIIAMDADVNFALHTSGSGSEGATLILDSNIIGTFALAIPLEMGRCKLSLGAAARFSVRSYTVESLFDSSPGGFKAGDVTDILDNEDTATKIMNTIPIAAGVAVPFDLGATLETPYYFRFSLVMRNLNGRYYMQTYSGINQFYHYLTGGYIGEEPSDIEEGESFHLKTPSSLDFGVSWSGKDRSHVFDYAAPTIEFDIVDIVGLCKDLSLSEFLRRTRFGCELLLIKTLSIRYGVREGYQSFGLGFDFGFLRCDVTYCTLEYGKELGDKGLDQLLFRFRFGF